MEIQNVRQRRMPRVAKTKNNVQENVQVRIRQCLEHDELHEGTRRSDHTRLDRELDEPVVSRLCNDEDALDVGANTGAAWKDAE